MAQGGARPGAGRPKGAKNKRTVELEQRGRETAAAIEAALNQAFPGDALALLQTVYRDPAQPIELRVDAAARAIRFERPSLSAIDVSTESTVRHVIQSDPLSPEERDREWIERHGVKLN